MSKGFVIGCQYLKDLVNQHRCLHSPRKTTQKAHDFVTEPQQEIRLRPYQILEAQRKAIKGEKRVMKMLTFRVIKEFHC